MPTTLRALAAVAVAAALPVLAACGGSAAETPAPAAPPSVPATAPATAAAPAPSTRTGEAATVETVFNDYYRSLLARDFAAACEFNAPETTEQLLTNLRERGVNASTCEEGLGLIYSVPGASQTADVIANSATIDDITVTGDDATITWSADINGGRPTVTSGLRRVDGRWLLVDTGR